jgi:hypothetical protein
MVHVERLMTQWSQRDWWITMIFSSDFMLVHTRVDLHLKGFLSCVKLLSRISIACDEYSSFVKDGDLQLKEIFPSINSMLHLAIAIDNDTNVESLTLCLERGYSINRASLL